MGPADPHDQTQDAAVGAEHAGHAEPAGSATHISQPAADTKRCVCLQEKRRTHYLCLAYAKIVSLFTFPHTGLLLACLLLRFDF